MGYKGVITNEKGEKDMLKLNNMSRLAMMIALTIVLGIFVQIKTATGFLTLLDAGIFFAAFYFGKKEGFLVGALSGFLIDYLLGYPQWMLVSLVAHGLQGYFAGWHGNKRFLGLMLATVVMVGSYFVASVLFYNLGEAMLGLYGNILQNTVGIVVGYLIYRLLKKY